MSNFFQIYPRLAVGYEMIVVENIEFFAHILWAFMAKGNCFCSGTAANFAIPPVAAGIVALASLANNVFLGCGG